MDNCPKCESLECIPGCYGGLTVTVCLSCGHRWDEEGALPRKNYVFVLERDGEVIDQTGLNEDDVSVAENLFFGEFGHGPRQDGDKVYLVEVERE